ncbi:hypothetical protein [Streptomyces cylindrosporus]|uniref:Integral membrane protein n=1 Tax=Streptomyces cylindrosporus TaxID=2927583 RepID=A0ABS9YI98_9ACTN|nr:hypothetical protein [Streptomyces cylindrosporus]MCI3276280.1 hypothetical protein [Streptomyces cylindrosporus]
MLPLRTYIAVARNYTGRAATLAGSAALTCGLFTDDFAAPTALATIAATGAGLLFATAFSLAHRFVTITARALYVTPGAGLLAILAAERIVPGTHWAEALAVAAWTAGVWFTRPARLARSLLGREPAPAVVATAPAVVVEAHPLSRWWAERVGVEGGIAPGTRLIDPKQTGPDSLQAVIAAPEGQPVPPISLAHLSALMDVPEELIAITTVPGRGAGLKRLTVGQAPTSSDPHAAWAEHIAAQVLPGTELLKVTAIDVDKELT